MNKKNLSLYIVFLLLGLISFSSCSNESVYNQKDDSICLENQIQFEVNFESYQTRVSTDAQFRSRFEEGDEIGIFGVSHHFSEEGTLASSNNYIHNAKLTYKSGKWISSEKLFYPVDNEVLDIYAYYPYSKEHTDPIQIKFNVSSNQNEMSDNQSSYDQSDLLSSHPRKNITKGEPVELRFQHRLSLIQVEMPQLMMHDLVLKGVGPEESLEVNLPTLKTNVTLDLTNNITITGNESSKIKMHRVEKKGDENYLSSYTFRALIPAQEIEENAIVNYTQCEQDFTYQLPATTANASKGKRFSVLMPMASIHTVKIPAGSNIQTLPGGEWPKVKITMTKSYRMSKYEITTAQFCGFLNDLHRDITVKDAYGILTLYLSNAGLYNGIILRDPSKDLGLSFRTVTSKLEGGKRIWEPVTEEIEGEIVSYANHPITWVTHQGFMAFAEWAGASMPTQAEWQHAARAGTSTEFYYGDDESIYGDYEWYEDNSGGNFHEVGLKKPNPWGLYDIGGNVIELVYDSLNGDNTFGEEELIDPIGEKHPNSSSVGSYNYSSTFTGYVTYTLGGLMDDQWSSRIVRY